MVAFIFLFSVDRWIDRQTMMMDRQTDRQTMMMMTDRQTDDDDDRQTDRQTDDDDDRQTDRR